MDPTFPRLGYRSEPRPTVMKSTVQVLTFRNLGIVSWLMIAAGRWWGHGSNGDAARGREPALDLGKHQTEYENISGTNDSLPMHPDAARLLDRLSETTHQGPSRSRLPFGLKTIDDTLGGGIEVGALHEIRTAEARGIGAAVGAVLGLLAGLIAKTGQDRVLWVTDPAAAPDAGLLYPDGIAQYGLDPSGVIQVFPMDLKAALWAADEGARCTDLAAVVLQVRGNPKRLDLVATRRLSLRARESGVAVLLLRQSGAAEASAATTRWRVAPLPSPLDKSFPNGIGAPQHLLELERARDGQTGIWPLVWDLKSKSYRAGHLSAETALPKKTVPKTAPKTVPPRDADILPFEHAV